MTKLRWFIGMSLLLTLMIVSVIALALPAGSQQPAERGTITLFDPNKTNWEKVLDEGREGPSPGDTILFIDAQFDPDTCERRATLAGQLVISKVLEQDNAWFIGEFTLRLPDGKLVAEAAARFSEFAQTEDGVFAVTGGTGAYRDASGEVKFQEDVTMCERRGTLTTIDIGPQP